ncbi:hypothetical protein [Roseibium sp. LAB1]
MSRLSGVGRNGCSGAVTRFAEPRFAETRYDPARASAKPIIAAMEIVSPKSNIPNPTATNGMEKVESDAKDAPPIGTRVKMKRPEWLNSAYLELPERG